jgi:hypothetical protein
MDRWVDRPRVPAHEGLGRSHNRNSSDRSVFNRFYALRIAWRAPEGLRNRFYAVADESVIERYRPERPAAKTRR